jgi:uncharacterized RDD family membrane protein YckC
MQSGMVTGAVEGQAAPLYPGLPLRMKAGIIDGIIIISLAISLPMLTSQIEGVPPLLNFIALLGPLLLLEPCLISFRGATLGQSWYGMSVVDVHTMERCPLPRAFLRYVVKVILGVVSSVYMFFSHRCQAIHDLLAGTVVVFTNAIPQYRSVPDGLGLPVQKEDARFVYPSIARRFVMFLAWFVGAYLAVSILVGLISAVVEPGCLDDKPPSDLTVTCDGIYAVYAIVLLSVFFELAYLGATGRLPGAKRKCK